jgi:hypothetical protein
MNDEDMAELTDFILPLIKKYTLEKVLKVIEDTYHIFDKRINPDILIREKGNSEKNVY